MKQYYREREMKEVMQRELEIPIVVTEKITDTLQKTCEDYDEKQCRQQVVIFRKRAKRKRQIAAALALCLLGTGTTVGAIELKKWNEYAAKELHADVEEQDRLVTDGLAASPEISVTDNDVTVSVEQIVMDGYSEYILFKIEAPENVKLPLEFGFDSVWAFGEHSELTVEEPSIRNCSGQALIDWNEATGQLEKVNQEDHIVYYAYEIDSTEENVLQGKEITIRLKNIVEYLPKAEQQVIREGEWELTIPKEIQENVTKEQVTCEMVRSQNQEMKKVSDWDEITITPLQLMIEFQYQDVLPYSEEDMCFDELTSVFPVLREVRMKNGEVLKIATEVNDYVEVNHDEKTQQKWEEYDKVRDYKNAQSAIVSCDEWSVKLCVNFPAAARTQAEENQVWQNGIIYPEQVEELAFEYQGEVYSYKISQ